MKVSASEKIIKDSDINVGYVEVEIDLEKDTYTIAVFSTMVVVHHWVGGELMGTKEIDFPEGKNIQAMSLGSMGGKIGGKVRAEKLSPERRREIAIKAANTRWKKTNPIGGDTQT